jgi:transcriptional regulator GlxA family with amidase domain
MDVGIFIYDRAEVLDFSGPFEVFCTASRVCSTGDPFRVFLVGQSGQAVSARGGYRVMPAFGFHDHPPVDVLLIAGGDHTEEMKKPDVISWISQQTRKAALVASVCTGAFLLAEAGVLKGRNVTTHWEDIAELHARYPDTTVHDSVRWIDDGPVVTSAGISAGIDMSLYLVSRLHSADLAEKTARQMDYRWVQNP